MARVGLVTTGDEQIRAEDVDIAPVLDALRGVAIDAELAVWDDTLVDWAGFDLLIMRSPWDYSERLAEFLAWLDEVSQHRPVLNPPDVIRWNLDKVYLLDLQSRGVTIVPTTLCQDLNQVTEAVAGLDVDEVVIKPTVSAASRDTELLSTTSPRVRSLAERILGLGKTVMVQPAIDSVKEVGEIASLYFDGEFSHSIRKGPLLASGGGLLGGEYTEIIDPASPSAEVRGLCDVAMKAIESIRGERLGVRETLLYARLDTVEGPDGPLLLEAELFEPSYFLDTVPGSAQSFADAVVRRIAAL